MSAQTTKLDAIPALRVEADRTQAATGSESALVARIPLFGFLAIQVAIGYEWLNSGLTKIVRGGFPSGLAAELREASKGTAAWYKRFLDGTVIPHGVGFGYLVEAGEVLTGIALIGTAIVWMFGRRPPFFVRSSALLLAAFAAFVAIFMNVNFHLANGAPHPWFFPHDGFDEGVDLDSLMPIIELVILAVSGWLWLHLRRHRSEAAPQG